MCYCSFLRFQIRRLAIPNMRPPTRFITGESTAAVFGKIGCGCSGTFGVGFLGFGLSGIELVASHHSVPWNHWRWRCVWTRWWCIWCWWEYLHFVSFFWFMVEAYFLQRLAHHCRRIAANIDAIFEACVQDKTEGASLRGI